jgi:hypothetical protein
MNKYVVWIGLLVLKFIPAQAATQAIFSLVANTATSVTVPSNRHTVVQYKVTNNTGITRTLTLVPIPNVTQVKRDATQCSNPFTLAKHQSCNLTLDIDGALQNATYAGGPVICKTKGNLNTPDPFLCAEPEASMTLHIYPAPAFTPTLNKLYVSNWDGGSISLCYLQEDSGELTQCLVSAVSDTFLNPEALAISGNYLFVANIGGGMSSCLIDATTGELSECNDATTDVEALQIHAPDGIAINDTTAYISNSGPESFDQGVTTCTVNGRNLEDCAFTQGNASFSIPSDLAFLDDTIYITNFESQYTTYCSISSPLCDSGTSGTINGTGDLLNEAEGLFFNTINSTSYAYFTNHGNNTVTLCQVESTTSFTNCADTEGHFTGFGNLTILSNPLKAYIPSGLKTIALCDVNESDGALSHCVDSTQYGFNNPSGLVIQ